MPPKQQSTKTAKKEKAKIIEDKTFGLKNKNKSSKVAQYIKQVEQNVQQAGDRKTLKAAEDAKKAQALKKQFEEEKKAELAKLFGPVTAQKVPFGVDPKTVLCLAFKDNLCTKGAKCKFSHDLNVGRRSEKIDIYTDTREVETMDNWDQKQLEDVVLSKQGNPRTTTDIVCKYFLEAIETKKYGWFWDCPNGNKECFYKHALPPGYVLKSNIVKEEKSEISIEEFLETERHKLGSNLTPITFESFSKWKQERKDKAEKELLESKSAKDQAFKSGKLNMLSGRELFSYNPELATDNMWEDDEDVFDYSSYKKEQEIVEETEKLAV